MDSRRTHRDSGVHPTTHWTGWTTTFGQKVPSAPCEDEASIGVVEPRLQTNTRVVSQQVPPPKARGERTVRPPAAGP